MCHFKLNLKTFFANNIGFDLSCRGKSSNWRISLFIYFLPTCLDIVFALIIYVNAMGFCLQSRSFEVFCESSTQLIASVVISTGFAVWDSFRILFRLLFEVSQMNAPSSSHTAEGSWIHFPVFNRIPKQAYYGVLGLLHAGVDGTKIIDSHFADFVAMEENDLNKEIFVVIVHSFFLCTKKDKTHLLVTG